MSISFSIKKSKCRTVPTTPLPKWLKTPKTATAPMHRKTLKSVAKANSSPCSIPHNKWPHLPILNSKDWRNLLKWFETLTTLLLNRIKKSRHSNSIKRKSSSPKTKCSTKALKPSIRSKNKSSKSKTKFNKRKFKISLKSKSYNNKNMGKREILFPLLKLKVCSIQMFKYSNKLFKTKKQQKTTRN